MHPSIQLHLMVVPSSPEPTLPQVYILYSEPSIFLLRPRSSVYIRQRNVKSNFLGKTIFPTVSPYMHMLISRICTVFRTYAKRPNGWQSASLTEVPIKLGTKAYQASLHARYRSNAQCGNWPQTLRCLSEMDMLQLRSHGRIRGVETWLFFDKLGSKI